MSTDAEHSLIAVKLFVFAFRGADYKKTVKPFANYTFL